MLRWWWFPPHNAMFWTVTLSLLQGMRQAAVLFGLTLAFSLPLGLLVALGSMSRCRPVRAVFDALVWVIRGTPLVLQLIIIFYGPGLWLGRNIWGSHRMLACIVAFVLNYACYFSVIYRGGIQATPGGPAGGRAGAGHDPAADLLPGHASAGGQADPAPHVQ